MSVTNSIDTGFPNSVQIKEKDNTLSIDKGVCTIAHIDFATLQVYNQVLYSICCCAYKLFAIYDNKSVRGATKLYWNKEN